MALHFDGSATSSISYGDITLLDGLTELSCHGFINLDTLSGDGYLMSKASGSTGIWFYYDDVGSASGREEVFSIAIQDGSIVKIEAAEGAATIDNWISVAFTADFAGNLRLYINGVEDANSPVTLSGLSSIPNVSASLLFADGSSSGKELDGQLAEMSFYNGILTPAQILSLSKGVIAPHVRPQDLIIYSPLIREQVDDIVSGLAGTINGTPVQSDHPPTLRASAQILQFPPVVVVGGATVMNQIQGSNLGADLYNGTIQ